MIARYTGAVLGLFAFGVATIAGLSAGNPSQVVLSRAIWSLIVFCLLGLFVGAAAQVVIDEYYARKEETILGSDKSESDESDGSEETNKSIHADAKPMGT